MIVAWALPAPSPTPTANMQARCFKVARGRVVWHFWVAGSMVFLLLGLSIIGYVWGYPRHRRRGGGHAWRSALRAACVYDVNASIDSNTGSQAHPWQVSKGKVEKISFIENWRSGLPGMPAAGAGVVALAGSAGQMGWFL